MAEKNGTMIHLYILFIKHLQCARHCGECKAGKDTVPVLKNLKYSDLEANQPS